MSGTNRTVCIESLGMAGFIWNVTSLTTYLKEINNIFTQQLLFFQMCIGKLSLS